MEKTEKFISSFVDRGDIADSLGSGPMVSVRSTKPSLQSRAFPILRAAASPHNI